MRSTFLEKAQKAVLHVINDKSMTVTETVDQASREEEASTDEPKVSTNELEAAIYSLLDQGRVKLDEQYRLKRTK